MIKFIRHKFRGYVLILLGMAIPVFVLLIRYIIVNVQFGSHELKKAASNEECAKNAALEVAKHWNPGLTLTQQKWSMLRIADKMYNGIKTGASSLAGTAAPGLEIFKNNNDVTVTNESVDYEIIGNDLYKYEVTIPSTLNQYVVLNELVTSILVDSYVTEENIFHDVVVYDDKKESVKKIYFTCSQIYDAALREKLSSIDSSIAVTVSSSEVADGEYGKRIAESDTKVQLAIDNDKIKVQIVDDIGQAVPAQCNVDIVLAIPTNGAACNSSNNDATSVSIGDPLAETGSEPSAELKDTLIYEIGQACKNFLKEHFYHTRGVNVGLIPYSGKVSVSSDKIEHTSVIQPFDSEDLKENPQSRITISEASMYGTKGKKDELLATTYPWGTFATGWPIMCRKNLLSTEAPTLSSNKFLKMNLNPCYLGYANFLSLKCEHDCTSYLPNPYGMIELTADLTKIYEMCNALYPIYDTNNTSNLIFIPLIWAYHFFQGWTQDSETNASSDVLSRQAKNASQRKKAVILFVNKPDWIEPGELTYIGFDNDMAEVSMAETDKIDFNSAKSDDGIFQGAKKIIKYTAEEDASKITGCLMFPVKGTVKIVVNKKETGNGDPTTGKLTILETSEEHDITQETAIVIQPSQLSKDDDGYQVKFEMTNVELISVEVTNLTISDEKSPSTYPVATNSRLCDWSQDSVSYPLSTIGLTEPYSNYSDEYHQINANSCAPQIYPLSHTGDVTVIFNAKSPFVPNIIMPEYAYNDADISLIGPVRLFSPIRRNSPNKYCHIKPYSETYDNKANLISTDFTLPINTILHEAGYQSSEASNSNAAAAAATRAACAKLKNQYGDNIRIYVIKYRKQNSYKSFPFYGTPQTNITHDYSTVDSCASGSNPPYLYEINHESELNSTFDAIAADIKKFAEYTDAKIER